MKDMRLQPRQRGRDVPGKWCDRTGGPGGGRETDAVRLPNIASARLYKTGTCGAKPAHPQIGRTMNSSAWCGCAWRPDGERPPKSSLLGRGRARNSLTGIFGSAV